MEQQITPVETAKRILNVTETLALFYTPANGHHSLRALRPLALNSVLHTFGAREYVQRPSYLSVQVDDDKHILLAPEFLQYINHSCQPNTFFDTKTGEVVAIRTIAPGEEITFFYPSTEWTMTQSFDCFCGSANCLGKIQGAAYLNKKLLANYRFAEHIQRRLARSVGESWKTTRDLALNAIGEQVRAALMPANLQEAFSQR